MLPAIFVRNLGLQAYRPVYEAMQRFAHENNDAAQDEVWLVEHLPVYTIGRSPLLGESRTSIDGIEVVAVDRGGDITYHGPGQIVLYPLLHLKQRGIFIKTYVHILEHAVIKTLKNFGIDAFVHPKAPGVYVHCQGGTGEFAGQAKIASIGVHLAKGCTYHGLSLNAAMDLAPFSAITPCGYKALRVIDMRTLGVEVNNRSVAEKLLNNFLFLLEHHGSCSPFSNN